ncbi:MAG: hypothetical protein ACYTGO_06895 [Planctomycetota bacterium]|jgi:topoisomerase IA-like protein
MKSASLFLTLVTALALPACTAEAESLPSQPPAKNTPAKNTPAKNTPAKNTPAKSTPAKSTPAKDLPAKDIPAKSGDAQEIVTADLVLESVPT